jgi:hypothetical protein
VSDMSDAEFRPDRREHAKAPEHLDDDRLARLTEQERAAAGLDPHENDEVPPAADAPAPRDITETEAYQEERAELRRRAEQGQLITDGDMDKFPPTRYDS